MILPSLPPRPTSAVRRVVRFGAVQGVVLVRSYTLRNSGAPLDLDELMRQKYAKRANIDMKKWTTRSKLAREFLRKRQQVLEMGVEWKAPKKLYLVDPLLPTSDELHYFHPIENTINGLIQELVLRALVEIHLHKELIGDLDDSRLLIGDLNEILSNNEQVRKILDELKQDPQALQSLARLFSVNEQFSDLESLRLNYMYTKSGQHLNYEDSERWRFIKMKAVNFTEAFEKDLFEVFEPVFSSYGSSQKSPIDQINLVLLLAHRLLHLEAPPTMSTLRKITDKLGEASLLNYETLFMMYVVPFKFKSTLLAEKINPQMLVEFYKPVIEQDPEFLGTLVDYYYRRGCTKEFLLVLSLLKFDEVLQIESVLEKSTFAQLISKSRFVKDRNVSGIVTVTYSGKTPLLVLERTMYDIITKCIELKQYAYIDILFNKLMFNSISMDGDRCVLLSISERINLKNYKFLLDTETVEQVVNSFFNKELVSILLEAVRGDNDMGRLIWLIPNLDIFLLCKSNARHLKKTAQVLRGWQSMSPAAVQEFVDLDKQQDLDLHLILRIFQALVHFRIDGKVVAYSRLLGLDEQSVMASATLVNKFYCK